jgi:hypothetical protein
MRNWLRHPRNREETNALLKDAFVCVMIPVAAFAIAYVALGTFARFFLG